MGNQQRQSRRRLTVDEFDDFDIGPQADEFIPDEMEDGTDLADLEDDDGISDEDDDGWMDDSDFRLLSSEWDEREEDETDWDWDND